MPPRPIPLLYVQRGRLMRPDAAGFRPHGDPEAALAEAKRLFADREELYLVDLDGQLNGAAGVEFLQALERQRVFPWIDAGCRKPEDAMDVLFAGAESLTVQLRHMSPEMMQEVQQVSEASFYVGVTAEERGLEKGLRARDVLDLARRVSATGVVFYEGERCDYHAAENAAFEIQRAGVPVTWVSRPGSTHVRAAAQSDRFSAHASAPG